MTTEPIDGFTDRQVAALINLEKALLRCRKNKIGFFVEESDIYALPNREELEENATDHSYIKENGLLVDDAGTIIDCGAWA